LAETLGQRIRGKREKADIGLREAAKKLKISPAYLSRIETDEEKVVPAEELLGAIARLLDDDVDALMHLAGRVPEDVSRMLKRDPRLPQFLRTAHDQGLTAKDLEALIPLKTDPK
jgi:transcriptional regulator with XRE-family HTH domain